MSIGLASALVAAGITFLVLLIQLLMSGQKEAEGSPTRDAFGTAAAAALAGGDDAAWTGGARAVTYDVRWIERQIGNLFGERGERWFDDEKARINPDAKELESMAMDEIEALQKRKAKWDETVEKLSGGSSGGADDEGARLGRLLANNFNRVLANVSKDGVYRVNAAQIIKNPGTGAQVLVSQPSGTSVSLDWSTYASSGSRGGMVSGTASGGSGSWPVTVYMAELPGSTTSSRLMAAAAVYEAGTSGGGGAGLGLLLLVLGPLLAGFGTFAVANGFGKKIKSLAREIDRLGSTGDPTRTLRADGAEAALVARSVERMVSTLEFRSKHDGADLDEVAQRERAVADEIHKGLVSKHPPRLDGYEVETLFKPGFEIGGDHFEYFRIDDGHLGLILLDTNVRGLQAALVMASTRAYVRTAAPGQLSPAQVLREVNRHLAGELPPGRHVTALYAVLDMAAGTATLASAGHLPLLVYRHAAGKLSMVNPEGLALGMDTGPVFDDALQEGEIPLGVGDRIVMYTDGALKIQDADGAEYGEQRFYQSVSREAPKNSQAFVNFVGSAIDAYHAGAQQNDDITISTIKRLR